MVAINIEPFYSLAEWRRFWKSTGAGDVLLAQDTDSSTREKYRLVALGTEIIINRQGQVTFRRDGPAGYKKLRSEIEEAL